MEFPREMPWWRRYLRFLRRNVQGDIDDELRFHLQTRIDELVAQGMAPDAARALALDEFGDVTTVRRGLRDIDDRMARREQRGEWFDAWRQDIAYAARSLRRTPGVTVTIVVTLALGLGVNAAMFTLLNAVYLRPPAGVVHPEQLRRLWAERNFYRVGRQFWPGYDYQRYERIREGLAGLGTAAIYRGPAQVKVGRGFGAPQAMMVSTSADYFRLLGVRLVLGRFFSGEEDRLGAGLKVAVVSDRFFRRSLGGDPGVLGQSILLNNESYAIVGVCDPQFTGVDLTAADVWVPFASMKSPGNTPWWMDSNVNGFQVLIRAAAGTSDDAIDAQATAVLRNTDDVIISRKMNNEGQSGQARPTALLDSTSVARTGSIIAARGPGMKQQEVQIALRLGGVALIVLIIACANVVNLLLARAVRRRREIAMRLALGISRARLTRLVLSESVLLAFLAGVAAIAAAQWGGLALRALLLPDVHWAHAPVDWRVLGGAVLATLAAGVVAGAIPAMQSGSTELTEVLKAGAREGYVRRSRARSALVVTQAALSVTLLVGAALFVRSLANVRALDLGFDVSRLLYAHMVFESTDAHRDSTLTPRIAELADRLRGSPGVQGVALTAMRPMWGFSTETYFPDADTIANRKPMGMFWAVSPGYFATTGTRLISGSDFPPDEGPGSAPAVIVNSAMAKALWPGQNPLGRCVRFAEPTGRCNTVIGVVETARWGAVIEDATPQFYLPLENMPFTGWNSHLLAIRADERHIPAVIGEVRVALKQAFPDGQPVIERMSDVMAPQYRPWRLGATLFTLFGILAAVVAAVGIYSTVSYSVNQRTHEFGVRVALGARLADVVRHVLTEGLRTVVIGILVGVALALVAGRLVASLLYGITPHDPAAIAIVVTVLLLVAAVAALVPALRAARVDPVTALRTE
jgi:putative ABC transport system permease protein